MAKSKKKIFLAKSNECDINAYMLIKKYLSNFDFTIVEWEKGLERESECHALVIIPPKFRQSGRYQVGRGLYDISENFFQEWDEPENYTDIDGQAFIISEIAIDFDGTFHVYADELYEHRRVITGGSFKQYGIFETNDQVICITNYLGSPKEELIVDPNTDYGQNKKADSNAKKGRPGTDFPVENVSKKPNPVRPVSDDEFLLI